MIMSNSNSTIDYPIKFFKVFFLEGGLKKYRDNFLDNANREKKQSPKDVEVIPYEIEIVLVKPTTNIIGEPTTETELFTDQLFQDLKKEVETSKNLLRDAIVEKYENVDAFIKTQRIIIRDIIDVNSHLLTSLPRCKEILKELDNYIAELTSEVEKPEKAIQQKRKRPEIHKTYNEDDVIQYSFFVGNDIKKSFLRWLYGKFCENLIIDELEDYSEGEEQFVEIFSSTHPERLSYSLRFKINNIEVAYIIDALQPFFKNLNPTSIEQSKCFIKNNSSDTFKRDDLYQASSKLKKALKSNQNFISNDVLVFVEEIKSGQITHK